MGEYIDTLREYQSYEIDEIRDNRTLRGVIERYVEVSLVCVINICEMIISSEKLNRPDTYREAIMILGQHEIFPMTFAEKLSPAAGFIIVLVHMYQTLIWKNFTLIFKMILMI